MTKEHPVDRSSLLRKSAIAGAALVGWRTSGPVVMREKLWKVAGALFLGCGLQLHGQAKAANIITFDPPGSTSTLGIGINPAGAITGRYRDMNMKDHGFLRAPDGTFTTFDVPGVKHTFPVAINPAGRMRAE